MVDIKTLQDVNYPCISVSALLSTDQPKKVLMETKAYVSVDDEAREEQAIAAYFDFLIAIAFKSDVFDVDMVAEKLCLSALSISAYPLKLMNANGSEHGLSVFPSPVTAPGLHSQNTNIDYKRYSYAGNAGTIAYGQALTENIRTRHGVMSFYEMAGTKPEWAKEILAYSALRDHRDTLVDRLASIFAIKRQHHKNHPVDQTIKQIYFPIDSKAGNYHLLSIVNNGGLRKGMSDYMTMSRAAALIKDGKTEIVNLRYPTLKMKVGGTKSVNSGEIINGMGGVVRMLSAVAPTYRPMKGISEARLASVAHQGNVFQLMSRRRLILDTPDKPLYSRLLDIMTTNNLRNRTVAKHIFADILHEVMRPVLALTDQVEAQDIEFFANMPLSMQKWLDPDRFSGSLSAGDYRELTDLCLAQFLKKVNILRDNQPVLLNDLLTGYLKDAMTIFLRRH